ncbi:MAG: T9SS type A sorting domain-containing protein [candidate division WOR-3 bacterium]|nr:T9SS type A sorting domain-containing protein [candidate division WOR-3 bacterium]
MTHYVQQRIRRSGRAWFGLAVGLVALAGLARAQWVPFSPPDSAPDRACPATAYDPLNDRIYMLGGTPSGSACTYVNLCQRYDPVADTWTTMAPMPTSRGWMSAAYVRNKVYVVGGYSNTGAALVANEEYTVATNSWATRAPLPVAVLAHMTGVWRDSLIYTIGGMDAIYNSIMTPQVYNPFTNSWADGTPLPKAGDMGGPAAIVGDTIYISNAYDRPNGQCWRRMLKGAINPDTATQITWLWGPWLPEHLRLNIGGTLSLHDKVYALGCFDTLPDTTATMTGLVYDPGSGVYTESLPTLLLEGVTSLSGQFVVAREAADEIYQIAGTGDYQGVSRYNKLFVTPEGTREAGPAVVPSSRLRVSTLFRSGVQIHYVIDRPCRTTLTVYDQSGRVVRTLVSTQVQVGSYTAAWDGRNEYGRPAGSGVYFCRLQAGGYLATKKLLMMR